MADIKEILIASQISKVGGQKVQENPSRDLNSAEAARFDKALQTAELQFSKHAKKRLEARSIHLTPSDEMKLQSAMGVLQQKGARDSLVLMGELALVVNVPSKTVITALGREQMKEQVFTNIDSTILVDR